MYLQRYHLRTRPLKWYVLTYFNPGKRLTSMYEIDLDKRKFHVHFMYLSYKLYSAVLAKKGTVEQKI